VDGARWVRQEILDANPTAALRVYVVWFDMFDGDERATVDTSLLADPRVTHLWDEGKVVGTWYARSLTRPEDPEWVEWDAFFVYPPGPPWAEAATRPARWGRTVIGKREDLRAAVDGLRK
jgi:hypothetical protein